MFYTCGTDTSINIFDRCGTIDFVWILAIFNFGSHYFNAELL